MEFDPYRADESRIPDNSNVGAAWLPKVLTMSLTPVALEQFFPGHRHLTFGIGIMAGVLLQNFIPPRGRRRQLYLLLALAFALALASLLF